jgi:hypothetical protein
MSSKSKAMAKRQVQRQAGSRMSIHEGQMSLSAGLQEAFSRIERLDREVSEVLKEFDDRLQALEALYDLPVWRRLWLRVCSWFMGRKKITNSPTVAALEALPAVEERKDDADPNPKTN